MKGRESGMPEKEIWESFFNPAEILRIMKLDRNVIDAVEFGCGYGTFTIPAARAIKGKIYAIDIDPEMIKITQEEAAKQRIPNIKTIVRDFIEEGTGLKKESMDYAMLFNILHIENPQILLRETWRILKPGGKVAIIHWNYDPKTPRGPSLEIRPKPQQYIDWAKAAGFSSPVQFDLKPYHYGIVLKKKV